jgi:uncharacterized membrane protein YfcA
MKACMTSLATVLAIFAAVLLHCLAGFGSSMVAMAVLPRWMDLREAAPLVSLVVATLEVILLLRYHGALKLRALWRMGAGMLVGAPIGVWALERLDPRLLTYGLGLLIVAYAAYGLLNWHVPELVDQRWGLVFGLLAGTLAGLFNFAGPVVVIYGQCRRWDLDEFKGNLQALFLVNQSVVIVNRAIVGAFTPIIWHDYLISLPVIALGTAVGFWLGRFVSPSTFRKLVLVLLLILGAQLLF